MKKTLFLMAALAAQSLVAAEMTSPTTNMNKANGMTPSSGMNSNGSMKMNGNTPSTGNNPATAPAQDRFTTPDDGKLGMEVRALLIETVGPDQAKGVILIIDKGDVQLTGTVPSEEKKRAIIDALTKNKGVKSVNNKLTTTPNGSMTNGSMKK